MLHLSCDLAAKACWQVSVVPRPHGHGTCTVMLHLAQNVSDQRIFHVREHADDVICRASFCLLLVAGTSTASHNVSNCPAAVNKKLLWAGLLAEACLQCSAARAHCVHLWPATSADQSVSQAEHDTLHRKVVSLQVKDGWMQPHPVAPSAHRLLIVRIQQLALCPHVLVCMGSMHAPSLFLTHVQHTHTLALGKSHTGHALRCMAWSAMHAGGRANHNIDEIRPHTQTQTQA